MFGYDSSSVAGANSDVAYGNSYGVLFSNPALLSRQKAHSGIDLMYYHSKLNVDLMERPAGADIPITMFDTSKSPAGKNLFRALPTVELVHERADNNIDKGQVYLGLGFNFSADKILKALDGLNVGGVVQLPLAKQVEMKTFYFDEREQYFTNTVHFARFGEWSPIVTGILGFSYSPPWVDWLSVGVGVVASVSAIAKLELYIPDPQVQSYMLTNTNMEGALKFRPVVGVQFEPTEYLGIGLTWRHESYMEVDGTGNLYLYNYHLTPPEAEEYSSEYINIPKRAKTKFKMAMDYEPMEVSLGLGFKKAGFTGQAAVTYNRWSQFRDIHNASPQQAAVYEPNNAGGTLVNGSDYAWTDTVSASASLAYKYYNDWFEAKIGGAFYPTPTPAQKGRTNYADNDLWCISAGHFFQWGELPFYTTIALQFWQMVGREVHKDPNQIRDEFPDGISTTFDPSLVPVAAGLQTNNPGFPGYSIDGWLIVSNISIHYQF